MCDIDLGQDAACVLFVLLWRWEGGWVCCFQREQRCSWNGRVLSACESGMVGKRCLKKGGLYPALSGGSSSSSLLGQPLYVSFTEAAEEESNTTEYGYSEDHHPVCMAWVLNVF